MDHIYEKAQNLQREKAVAKKEVTDKLNFTEQQLMLLTQEMKEKIHRMVEDVEQRVMHFLLIIIYKNVLFVTLTFHIFHVIHNY